jgi:hypothetical protein
MDPLDQNGPMEIRDIIKSDSDRLFIVDPECYIIFTGETTDDIKPFIRIGNWNDMPVELVPLIENIIITDSLIGNPAHEQFNIEVRHLPENRYIGSRGIVQKFLNYQRTFGLDLTNASIVDIEKDLPDYSKEKNISHKDQFIGVFYRNGNFKTLLNKNTIFDLGEVTAMPLTRQKLHDLLSETHRGSRRYDGSGMVIVGHNPMFYDKSHFCTYLFPANYLRDFSLLGIDPGKIEAVLHPSLNLITISTFFKWLNNTGRKIKIFSNSTDIELLKKLYAGAVIRKDNFSGLNYRADSGLTIRNYPDTFNLKVIFNNVSPGSEGMTVAYLKAPGGAREIIRDKPDLIVASYTAYEDIALLLKSTTAPCAVIDDGNRNIRKLAGGDRIILSPGIHYALYRFVRAEDMAACAGLGEDLTERITGDTDALLAELTAPADGDAAGESLRKLIFNILSLARVYQHETRDRKLSARLRDFTAALTARYGRPGDFIDPARHIIALALYNGGLFQFMTDYRGAGGPVLFDTIESGGEAPDSRIDPSLLEYRDRVLRDRERLARLIEIYTRSAQYHEKNMPGMTELKRAIGTRKDQYREESLSLDYSWSRSIAGGMPEEEAPAEAGPAGFLERAAERIRALPRPVKLGVPIAALLIIIAAVLLSYNAPVIVRVLSNDSGTAVQSRDIDTRYRKMAKEMNLKVRDHDILEYANRVALKNGYHKISATRIKELNPDWIYPENVFTMLDGQRVVVSPGDTLWNLSRNKLIESSIRFNEIMKQLPAADAKTRQRLLREAKNIAYTDTQRDTLDALTGTAPAGAQEKAR